MHCSRCATPVPNDQQFCPACGAPIERTVDGPPPPPAGTEVFQQPASQQPQAQQPQQTEFASPAKAQPAEYAPPVQQAQPEHAPAAQQAPIPPTDPTSQQAPISQASPAPVQAAPIPQQSLADQGVPLPQPNNQQPVFIPQPAPATSNQPSPKKNRKPLVIAAAAVLVILLGVGGFFGYNAYVEHQRSKSYQQAIELMDSGDYEGALSLFSDLEDYEDSRNLADTCTKTLAFHDAEALFNSKDYAGARDAFAGLDTFMEADQYVELCDAWLLFADIEKLTADGKFDEASQMADGLSGVPEVRDSAEVKEWRNENNYGIADQMYQNGQYYGAYTRFTSLGSYEDSAARAEACVSPLPDSVELYHNDGFISSSTDVIFDAGDASIGYYIKVYSGDALVSTLYVHPGAQTTIQVPPGVYTFKNAWGDTWFGEEEMFGIDGHYSVMLFEGSEETVTLEGNMIYTVTLYSVSGGNVGSRTLDAGSF